MIYMRCELTTSAAEVLSLEYITNGSTHLKLNNHCKSILQNNLVFLILFFMQCAASADVG